MQRLRHHRLMEMKKCTILAGIASLIASQALGQGCAMCKTSLVGQNGDVVSSLQAGVVVLLIPPLVIMGTILHRVFYQGDTR